MTGVVGCGRVVHAPGYLWSEVFCEDMFASRFGVDHLMDSAVGAEYVDKILAPGGSEDAADMVFNLNGDVDFFYYLFKSQLRNFLGREPSKAAFLRSKGLQA